MTPSGAFLTSFWIPIGLFRNLFKVFRLDYWKTQLFFIQNLALKAESGWTWTGGSTTSKVTWTEIWGDGENAAIKDDTAIVFSVDEKVSHDWLKIQTFKLFTCSLLDYFICLRVFKLSE